MKNNKNMIMIISTARSGTTLLQSLFHNNGIHVLSEIFNLDSLGPAKLKIVLKDPLKYFKNEVYRSRHSSVCFKLFYYHARPEILDRDFQNWLLKDAHSSLHKKISVFYDFVHSKYDTASLGKKFNKVWEEIQKNKNIKIIHLVRQNKLQSLLSLKVAYKTNVWNSTKDSISNPKIALEKDECLRYFQQTAEYEKQICAMFESHQFLPVTYEDFVKNRESELEKISDFIGIELQNTNSKLKKQASMPMIKQISNYDILKKLFQGTEYDQYFI